MTKLQLPENPRIDIHTHILPKEWPDLAERYGYGGFVQLVHEQPGCAKMMIDGQHFRTVDQNLWDPQTRIDECDKQRIDVQVLSTVPVMFSYWAQPEHALDLSRILNDHIAGLCRDFPNRFAGLATLPMQAPDLAIQEMERCVSELGITGIEIGTHVNEWNLNAPELFPVFQRAEELNVSIFVHPWDMMGREKMGKYWLPWLVGMPAESSLAICSLIFGGVFERLPNLKVAIAHGGGSFPQTIGRIEHGFNVRPDLCAIDNKVNPREYLGKFYLDTLVHDPDVLKFLMNLVGVNSLALGTDYPFPLGELQPGALIDGLLGVSESDKNRMLGGTAREWLGI